MITNLFKKFKSNNDNKNVYNYKSIEKDISQSLLEYPIKPEIKYNTYSNDNINKNQINPLTLKTRNNIS